MDVIRGFGSSRPSVGTLLRSVVVHHQVQVAVGVGVGEVLRNASNSWLRCRCLHSLVTLPVASSNAANNVAAPRRT